MSDSNEVKLFFKDREALDNFMNVITMDSKQGVDNGITRVEVLE